MLSRGTQGSRLGREPHVMKLWRSSRQRCCAEGRLHALYGFGSRHAIAAARQAAAQMRDAIHADLEADRSRIIRSAVLGPGTASSSPGADRGRLATAPIAGTTRGPHRGVRP
jgi:hypothetical protein